METLWKDFSYSLKTSMFANPSARTMLQPALPTNRPASVSGSIWVADSVRPVGENSGDGRVRRLQRHVRTVIHREGCSGIRGADGIELELTEQSQLKARQGSGTMLQTGGRSCFARPSVPQRRGGVRQKTKRPTAAFATTGLHSALREMCSEEKLYFAGAAAFWASLSLVSFFAAFFLVFFSPVAVFVSAFLSSAKAAVPRTSDSPSISDIIFFMGVSLIDVTRQTTSSHRLLNTA